MLKRGLCIARSIFLIVILFAFGNLIVSAQSGSCTVAIDSRFPEVPAGSFAWGDADSIISWRADNCNIGAEGTSLCLGDSLIGRGSSQGTTAPVSWMAWCQPYDFQVYSGNSCGNGNTDSRFLGSARITNIGTNCPEADICMGKISKREQDSSNPRMYTIDWKATSCINNQQTAICREIENPDGSVQKFLVGLGTNREGEIKPDWIQCGTDYSFQVYNVSTAGFDSNCVDLGNFRFAVVSGARIVIRRSDAACTPTPCGTIRIDASHSSGNSYSLTWETAGSCGTATTICEADGTATTKLFTGSGGGGSYVTNRMQCGKPYTYIVYQGSACSGNVAGVTTVTRNDAICLTPLNKHDINNDGTVDVTDTNVLQRVILGQQSCPINTCDLNNDGRVDVLDFQELSTYLSSAVAPIVSGVSFVPSSISQGRSLIATFSGTGFNNEQNIWFDVKMRVPVTGIIGREYQLDNWQHGATQSHNFYSTDPVGTYTIIGARAHAQETDHSGTFTNLNSAFTVTSATGGACTGSLGSNSPVTFSNDDSSQALRTSRINWDINNCQRAAVCVKANDESTYSVFAAYDFNGDGRIDSQDSAAFQNIVLSGSQCPLRSCDLNKDNRVDVLDIQVLTNYAISKSSDANFIACNKQYTFSLFPSDSCTGIPITLPITVSRTCSNAGTTSICGNSAREGTEQCDNGNANTNSQCIPIGTASCTYCDRSCVSHTVNPSGGEDQRIPLKISGTVTNNGAAYRNVVVWELNNDGNSRIGMSDLSGAILFLPSWAERLNSLYGPVIRNCRAVLKGLEIECDVLARGASTYGVNVRYTKPDDTSLTELKTASSIGSYYFLDLSKNLGSSTQCAQLGNNLLASQQCCSGVPCNGVCQTSCPAPAVCGDGVCQNPQGENSCTCMRDCTAAVIRSPSCSACTNDFGCALGQTCNTNTGQCSGATSCIPLNSVAAPQQTCCSGTRCSDGICRISCGTGTCGAVNQPCCSVSPQCSSGTCQSGTCVATSGTCTDSDGRNYNVRGTANGVLRNLPAQTYTDGCDTNPASSAFGNLVEYYCSGNILVEESYKCPTSCRDGACIQNTGCPSDAKLCPDGSSVSRVPPGCDFTPCPTTGTCGNSKCDIPSETICSCTKDCTAGLRPESCGACTNNNGCPNGYTCNTNTGQCSTGQQQCTLGQRRCNNGNVETCLGYGEGAVSGNSWSITQSCPNGCETPPTGAVCKTGSGQNSYTFTVQVQDSSTPKKTTTKTFTLKVN